MIKSILCFILSTSLVYAQDVKVVKKEAEDGKVAVRNIRKDINNKLRRLEKDGDITEDELKAKEDIIQKSTDKFVATIDETLAKKEKELLNI